MKNMRILGNMIQKLSSEEQVSAAELGEIIHCPAEQVAQLFKGRLLLGLDQLSAVADRFRVSLDELMDGDVNYYRETIVDCMGGFSHDENLEEILDIIDDYLDLRTAVEQQ